MITRGGEHADTDAADDAESCPKMTLDLIGTEILGNIGLKQVRDAAE